jgi:hypothetical protein
VLHQAFIPAPHQHLNSCEGESSNVLCHYICQKWCKSDGILKNFNELLVNLKTQNFSQINSIKTYDFSILYTAIPHDKSKSRLLDITGNCLFNKNGKRKYSYLVISHQKDYFVKYHSDFTHKYSEAKIKKDAGIPHRQYLCSCWRTGLPTVCWNSHGYKLCPVVNGSVFVFI